MLYRSEASSGATVEVSDAGSGLSTRKLNLGGCISSLDENGLGDGLDELDRRRGQLSLLPLR